MIDMGLIVLGVILFLFGKYGLAFWLIVFSIISGAGAALKAVANPDWYYQKRLAARLEVDIIGSKQIRSFVIAKVVTIVPLFFVAWYLGGKAGYF